MVEMGEPEAVEKCIEMLHGVTIFKNRLQLRMSKQEFLSDSGRPFTLDDGSDSFVDFTNSRNNRFLTREQAAKNRFQPPGKVITEQLRNDLIRIVISKMNFFPHFSRCTSTTRRQRCRTKRLRRFWTLAVRPFRRKSFPLRRKVIRAMCLFQRP